MISRVALRAPVSVANVRIIRPCMNGPVAKRFISAKSEQHKEMADDVRANLAADEELQRRGESAMEMGVDISQLSEAEVNMLMEEEEQQLGYPPPENSLASAARAFLARKKGRDVGRGPMSTASLSDAGAVAGESGSVSEWNALDKMTSSGGIDAATIRRAARIDAERIKGQK